MWWLPFRRTICGAASQVLCKTCILKTLIFYEKKLILPALLLCAGMSLQAQQQQASAFYLRPAVSLRAPLQGDSINFTGDKFAMKELLKTK